MEPTVTMSLKDYDELKSIRDAKYSKYDIDVQEGIRNLVDKIQTMFLTEGLKYQIELHEKNIFITKL